MAIVFEEKIFEAVHDNLYVVILRQDDPLVSHALSDSRAVDVDN